MIGIIGAMKIEVEALKAAMTDKKTEKISGIEFVSGDVKYSCEINKNGRVIEKEVDSIDTFEEKLEITFALIIAWILSIFGK